MRSVGKPLVGVVLAAVAGGCAFAAAPAPATYDLQAPREFSRTLGSSGAQLAITEPAVVGALDNERIMVRPAPTSVTFLGRSQWSDRVPRLVQARLIETFQNTGRIRSVGLPGSAVAADVGLVTDLRAFHVDAASRRAVMDMTVRLVAERDGRVMASRQFEVAVPIASDSPEAIVAGLNAAFEQMAVEIAAWTLARI